MHRAKRFIDVERVADAFLERFQDELRSRRMGDPLERETKVGPHARVDLRDSLHAQVEESIKHGAQLLLGGRFPPGRSAFYPPTLLAIARAPGAWPPRSRPGACS